MIKVIDSYDSIKPMLGTPFVLQHWKEYACCISASLPSKCLEDIADYDFDRQCVPVLNSALMQAEGMETAHVNFELLIKNINKRVEQCFSCEVEAEIIFYLGLCNGAGWATQLDNKPTVLIGIEKVIELKWYDIRSMSGLVYHELGHLLHFQNRKQKSFADTNQALWQLYTEGMAMLAEQELMEDGNFFHQDEGEWLLWCRDNRSSLFREYLRRVQARESVQDFFGDWCSYREHSDVGYYLGAVLVRSLSQHMDFRQLCDCSAEQIKEQLCKLAEGE